MPPDEARLRAPVVVDQLATICALPVMVARAAGYHVANLPGWAMRRIADLRPGNAKTDARDAYVIADAARMSPHILRGATPDPDGSLVFSLRSTPAPKRVLVPMVETTVVLELPGRFGGPCGLRAAGCQRRLKTEQLAAGEN